MAILLLLGVTVAAAIVPGAGSELALAGAAALASGPVVALLIVAAAGAQAAGKLAVYAAAAGGARRDSRIGRALRGVAGILGHTPWSATSIVFISALISVPPLHVTAVACGAAGHGSARFAMTVLVARSVRYALLVLLLDQLRTALP